MDNCNILSEIKRTELKAKKLKEKALIDKNELISEAKRTAIQLAGDAVKDAKKPQKDLAEPAVTEKDKNKKTETKAKKKKTKKPKKKGNK